MGTLRFSAGTFQITCICLLWVCLFSFSVHPEERPNVILLMGDDHGWAETGYNGHPHLKTPILDEMSKTGLRMDHFYSGHPSCSPTRGGGVVFYDHVRVWKALPLAGSKQNDPKD